jgi:hypothetical protein
LDASDTRLYKIPGSGKGAVSLQCRHSSRRRNHGHKWIKRRQQGFKGQKLITPLLIPLFISATINLQHFPFFANLHHKAPIFYKMIGLFFAD